MTLTPVIPHGIKFKLCRRTPTAMAGAIRIRPEEFDAAHGAAASEHMNPYRTRTGRTP
jgi:hypothetical protein